MDLNTEPLRPFVSQITLGRIAIAVAVVLLVWLLSDVVLLVFFAALLAAALRGAADWIAEHTGLPVWLALTLITLSVAAILVGSAMWIGPELAREGRDLVHRLSEEYGTLRQRLEGTEIGHSLAQQSPPQPGDIVDRVTAPIRTVLNLSLRTIADLVVLVVTALYFAAAPETYIRGILHLVPIPHRPRARQVIEELGQTLRYWFLGQLIDMVATGILAAIGLAIVGVPVPYVLGVVAGLLTFVPYFGAILAGIPAILVGLTVSLSTAFWALVVFTLCHCFEGYVIGPLVQRRLVELPPALTVISMTVMATLFGSLGVILGTPIAAAGLVAVRMLYVGDVLGDHEAESSDERPR